MIRQLVTIIIYPVLLSTEMVSSIASCLSQQNWHWEKYQSSRVLKRFHDQSLLWNSFQIATNLLEGMFMHELWAEHISCSTVNSISNFRACMSSKIQKHSNHTTVVEIARGRFSCTCLARGYPLAGANFLFAVLTSIQEFPTFTLSDLSTSYWKIQS